jgi:hypothetical protein
VQSLRPPPFSLQPYSPTMKGDSTQALPTSPERRSIVKRGLNQTARTERKERRYTVPAALPRPYDSPPLTLEKVRRTLLRLGDLWVPISKETAAEEGKGSNLWCAATSRALLEREGRAGVLETDPARIVRKMGALAYSDLIPLAREKTDRTQEGRWFLEGASFAAFRLNEASETEPKGGKQSQSRRLGCNEVSGRDGETNLLGTEGEGGRAEGESKSREASAQTSSVVSLTIITLHTPHDLVHPSSAALPPSLPTYRSAHCPCSRSRPLRSPNTSLLPMRTSTTRCAITPTPWTRTARRTRMGRTSSGRGVITLRVRARSSPAARRI